MNLKPHGVSQADHKFLDSKWGERKKKRKREAHWSGYPAYESFTSTTFMLTNKLRLRCESRTISSPLVFPDLFWFKVVSSERFWWNFLVMRAVSFFTRVEGFPLETSISHSWVLRFQESWWPQNSCFHRNLREKIEIRQKEKKFETGSCSAHSFKLKLCVRFYCDPS